ncbi:hypothetical protein ANCDUO_09108 [Ancylostoma duodenale]|uniref:Helicase protein n=1 Tax=Ancylostoma duodenale TaxID=51022 RepID=A0A0C2CUQ1_9BILA|nr:hypothetical protein ANCDUO_09108 [Ancylostoma duodenale]
MVLELQKALPNARVVYASATGATEPRNMAYMTRLGLWGQGQAFPEFINFINAVERRGVGAMEIVAMDMKQRGLYLARQLSFRGVSFTVQEVPLSDEFVKVYDDSVKLWLECRRQFQNVVLRAVLQGLIERHFPVDVGSIDIYRDFDISTDDFERKRRKMYRNGDYDFLEQLGFGSSSLSRGSPTEPRAKRPRPDEDQNSTTSSSGDEDYGDLDQDSGLEEEVDGSEADSNLEDGDDWLKALLAEAASSSESDDDDPTAQAPDNGSGNENSGGDQKGSAGEEEFNPFNCDFTDDPWASKQQVVEDSPRKQGQILTSAVDAQRFFFKMTGRKGRIVTRDDGEVEYELRHAGADVPLELMNMDEKDKFMKGEKKIAIISEAASSGISLQSDRRAQNTRRRVHITLELPWSADKAIQQFGRTHRSNQVSAPEYVFLISELAGEKRFASIVAKRLESLGALTHGDRRATETRDLSQFNLDNRYGRDALEVLLKSVTGTLNPPLIPPPADYKPGDFFQDMRLYMEGVGLLSRQANSNSYTIEREAATISKFLNRILGIPVHAQNALFHYFTEIVAELIAQAKLDGTYDMGIMDLGTGGDQVRKLETRVFVGRAEKGGFRVEMQKIGVERGISWDEAFALFKEHNSDEGLTSLFNLGAIDNCHHTYVHGKCKSEAMGVYCEVGRRTRTYFVLSGSVLSVWPVVEEVLSDRDRRASRMQVIRVRTDQDQKIVGVLVLPHFVRTLVARLEEHCSRCFVEAKKE